jgi:hypothetical protein|tara:strand:+ start:64 stop:960 length:897 start_codon:yes stop_codon:yes gene_type:complete
MATKLLHKRGTSDPTASDLDVGEIGINTTDGGIFTKTSGGSIVEAGGGGGGATINNNADNRVITGSGTSGTLEAESTFTYTPSSSNYVLDLSGQDSYVKVGATSTGNTYIRNRQGTSYYYHNGGGKWHFGSTASGTIQFDTVSKIMAEMKPNAEVTLWHNNTKQFETTTDGVNVLGGVLGLKNTGTQSELRLYCESNNAHFAAIKAPAHSDFSGNLTFTLPGGYGSNNQVLTSNGSGGLSWTTPASGGTYTAGTGLNLSSNAFSIAYGNSSSNAVRKITTSTSAPSGGSDGDIWIKYT